MDVLRGTTDYAVEADGLPSAGRQVAGGSSTPPLVGYHLRRWPVSTLEGSARCAYARAHGG
jgi:hypothetical protein